MRATSINRDLYKQRKGLEILEVLKSIIEGPEFRSTRELSKGQNFSLKLKTIHLKLRVFILEEASKEHIVETSPHSY